MKLCELFKKKQQEPVATEFVYRQEVRITKGFYRGTLGYCTAQRKGGDYLVSFNIGNDYEWFPADYLEKR